jgi:uncharacterized protein YndB with AHSA1/START domain
MKGVLIGLGALAAVAAIVTIVGALLPAGHVAVRRARYHRRPEELFAVITDFAAAPAWRKDVKQVELLPPREGRTTFCEHGAHGKITFEVDELAPPARLVVRIADPGLPFGGSWTTLVEAAPGGATVTITERGEVKNPVFRFLSRFVFSQHATLDAYLEALGAKLGDPVKPEG